ncbi:MAG TPA: DnaJ domain-containing protein [bacterium]|nr:DnaJ domain-containing protein [bacterium]HOL48690.1 DnaJ domain-containing protein [bacterium]HPQ19865.1 DnaJ domain-containing protein [bacterium]
MPFIFQNYRNEYLEAFNFFGISPDTPFEDVKLIYKKLALKYHPDKNKSKYAEYYFKKLNNAYSYLVDFYKNIDKDELTGNFDYSKKNYWNTPWGAFFDSLEKYENSLNNFFINLCQKATLRLKISIKKILAFNLPDAHKYSFKHIINYILNSSLKVKEWAVQTIFKNINNKYLLPYTLC